MNALAMPLPKWAWMVLLVAALTLTACEPGFVPPQVSALTAETGMVHARGASISAFSEDGGHEWFDEGQAQPSYTSGQVDPEAVCETEQPLVCYRLKPERVERSDDGGVTWRVVWQVPALRHDYIERYASRCFPGLGCNPKFDPGPYDLILTGPSSANGLQTLVVAMGNEGALVRTPEGTWTQSAVQEAQPTSERALSLEDAVFVLTWETYPLFLIAPILLLVAICWSWSYLLRGLTAQAGAAPTAGYVSTPFMLGIGLCILLPVLFILPSVLLQTSISWNGSLLSLCTLLVLAVGIVWSYIRIARVAVRAQFVWFTAAWCVVLVVVAVAAWLLPLMGWAFGLYPYYYLALVIALVLLGAWMYWGWKTLKRMAYAAGASS